LPHSREIIRRASHQIASTMFLKKREWLIDQVSVKIPPQVVFNVTRNSDQDAALKK
jgi:hypothetical protein